MIIPISVLSLLFLGILLDTVAARWAFLTFLTPAHCRAFLPSWRIVGTFTGKAACVKAFTVYSCRPTHSMNGPLRVYQYGNEFFVT